MDDQAKTAEEAVVDLIASTYMPATGTASAPEVVTIATTEAKFEFDDEFQTKVATHVMRNLDFMRKAAHLMKPEYFENAGEAAMVNIALRYYKEYGTVPTALVAKQMLAEDIKNKVISTEVRPAAIDAFKAVFDAGADLSDGMFVAQRVAEFSQYQALSAALLEGVELLSKKQTGKIMAKMKAAVEVGLNTTAEEYDYFDRINERTATRSDRKAGKLPPTGITTGHVELDKLLYHSGWGRKELSVILGGAKSGKTTALLNFAKSASVSGKNVLYVTCEVSKEIISERLDACITDTMVKALTDHMHDVAGKVKAMMPRSGKLQIAEYPSGTLTPAQLRALIERYKGPMLMPDGRVRPPIQFDMIVVDYADIMAPDFRTTDTIENSKQIYLALRAIATEENVAMLTATQTNREGFKSTVAKAEHVADDFNKVRTVDIMISINATDEERANGEARLFFAASRNQEGGFMVFIKQELSKMKFISSILRIE